MRHNRKSVGGFSLLELIIVLVIIGVLLAAVTISMSDRRLDNLKVDAQRIEALVKLAIDQAVINNREIGLLIEDDGYQFLEFEDENWRPLSTANARRFSGRKLAEGVYTRIQVAGFYNSEPETNLLGDDEEDSDDNNETNVKAPQILMLSSGEVTPFRIRIGWDFDDPAYMEIITEIDGSILLKGPIYDSLNGPWDSAWPQ